jgi:hypothetical protein
MGIFRKFRERVTRIMPQWHELNEWQWREEKLANGYTKRVQQRKQIALDVEGLTRWVDQEGYDIVDRHGNSTHIYTNPI